MKLLPGLVFIVAFSVSMPAFGQGVRMSADFLPLEVGNKWIYDVTDESGRKTGQMEFGVEDYTIISGISYYVLTEFPFTNETGARIRHVRYDRQERQFIRMVGADQGPLFLNDAGTTEVLQTDSAGTPVKFVLKSGSMALTFERGIGIIEARAELPGGVQIARIANVQGKSFANSGPGRTATAVGPSSDAILIPAAPPPSRTETVASVSDTNPHLDVYSMEAPEGLKLVFVLENTSDKLLPFKFSSGQNYDFVITNAVTGSEVWRWSKGQFFTQVVRSEAIRANSKWTFEVIWKLRDSEGKVVSPGQYHLRAILTAQPPLQSPISVLSLR